MDMLHNQILHQFQLVGEPVSCERYGFGHINETYLVVTDQSVRYILQKINNHVFPHVDQLQHNIAAVTEYLRKQTDEKYGVLHCAIPNIPSAVPKTASYAYSYAIYPYLKSLGEKGIIETIKDDIALSNGVNTFNGEITNEAVAQSLNQEFTQIELLVGFKLK